MGLTTIPNRNYRSDRPGGLILYCTALFCTVLYKKRRMKEGKMRKFAYKKRTDKQTDRQTRNSNTETTLSSSSVDNRRSWPIRENDVLLLVSSSVSPSSSDPSSAELSSLPK